MEGPDHAQLQPDGYSHGSGIRVLSGHGDGSRPSAIERENLLMA